MESLIAIGSEALSVEVATTGAELRSLKDASGQQFLWQGDQTHWQQRAPLLFPVIGLPREGLVWFEGRAYPIERHGFAHGLTFEVVEQSGDAVRLQAIGNAATRLSFPYDFRLVVDYCVSASGLTIAATVINDERDRSMPFCLGFHPGFVWPLPGNTSKSAHVIEVASKATIKERRIASGSLMGVGSTCHGQELRLELDEALFAPGAIILEDAQPLSISYRGPNGPAISIEPRNLAHLGIWSKGQGQYVCIEPWSALPQSEDYLGDLSDRPDATNLAPGTETAFSMTVSIVRIS